MTVSGGKSRNADFKLIAGGDTTPSELFEPYEPSEPGPQSGPMGDTTTLWPVNRVSPLWCLRHHLLPASGGTIKL